MTQVIKTGDNKLRQLEGKYLSTPVSAERGIGASLLYGNNSQEAVQIRNPLQNDTIYHTLAEEVGQVFNLHRDTYILTNDNRVSTEAELSSLASQTSNNTNLFLTIINGQLHAYKVLTVSGNQGMPIYRITNLADQYPRVYPMSLTDPRLR